MRQRFRFCRFAVDGSDALRVLCHRPQEFSPRQWQRTALAASVITDIAAKSLTQLTRRCYELNPHWQQALGKALQQATDVVQQANAEWKGVRQAWHGPVAAGPLSASVREQHLDQTAVRLGRLLYDNPTWTPARQDYVTRTDLGKWLGVHPDTISDDVTELDTRGRTQRGRGWPARLA